MVGWGLPIFSCTPPPVHTHSHTPGPLIQTFLPFVTLPFHSLATPHPLPSLSSPLLILSLPSQVLTLPLLTPSPLCSASSTPHHHSFTYHVSLSTKYEITNNSHKSHKPKLPPRRRHMFPGPRSWHHWSSAARRTWRPRQPSSFKRAATLKHTAFWRPRPHGPTEDSSPHVQTKGYKYACKGVKPCIPPNVMLAKFSKLIFLFEQQFPLFLER